MQDGIGNGSSESIEQLHAALDAAGIVGIWDWNHVSGGVVYDIGAARILMGDAAVAGREISGSDTIARVHPADRDRVIEQAQKAVVAGGLVSAEYRVVTADGSVRWLLSRGRTTYDAIGRPQRSRGIMIDLTEGRESGERGVIIDPERAETPLSRAIDLALALRDALGADAPSDVRLAADLVLMSLGQALARSSRMH